MDKTELIAVTGAAGFIGSCLVAHLNALGYHNLLLVDDFSNKSKVYNLMGKAYALKIHREQFMDWCAGHPGAVRAIFHLGARTDTTLMDKEVFKKLNLSYSKAVWEYCAEQGIPMVYASSAATYGDGAYGYDDDHDVVRRLVPLNPYGASKNDFDIWALDQKSAPPFWAGLKFFNVYGPNEYHKGRMASVAFHAYQQIKDRGYIRLFRSHRPDFEDGGQLRDFVYVKDVVKVVDWLMEHRPASGLYNVGTGQARSFIDLAQTILRLVHPSGKVEFIDTPLDIRDKYQYFTQANMDKLRMAGYTEPFYTLEAGVEDYLHNYLEQAKYW